MSKVSVLIPVFNERDSVGELLNRVRAVPLEMEVIVVDDHSTDGTAEVLAGLDIDDVVVVTHMLKTAEKGRQSGLLWGSQRATWS